MEKVEGLVDDGRRLTGRFRPRKAARSDARPVLQQAEARPPLGVERDHLAVDDRLARVDPGSLARELGEIAGRVQLVAGPDPGATVTHDRLDAIAVPLDLEQPVGVVEGGVGKGRLHRRDEVGHRPLASR